jgi:hypothetical protein
MHGRGTDIHPQVGIYGRSIHIQPYIDSYMHAHTLAREHVGGASAYNDSAASKTDRAHLAPAESGAYRGQRRDGGYVPRVDVRVEGRRPPERLRADDKMIDDGGKKCSLARVGAGAGAPTRNDVRALARAWTHATRKRICSGGCMHGRSVHPSEKFISIHSYIPLSPDRITFSQIQVNTRMLTRIYQSRLSQSIDRF